MCNILHTTDRIIKGVNDMTKAQRYFMEIKDKRVAFIGTGVSHLQSISQIGGDNIVQMLVV